ncbi:larval cuticle protein 65Ag1 isoform X2 [Folsomia candida]|uniref:Larval cuticle protein 8 n=1 Tax=Folsomia candida TaxID=158441 RepID=A0A226EPT3_FOLCA|nr:larval cuticle protein 65Ag1 isoform X2 [Folsomia candida]OXA59499.1 Larval cuticle protein 8 [Folsomia candida]
MQSAIVALALLVGAVLAYPQKEVTVTRSEFENNGDNFNWVSELSDGNTHSQQGTLKQIGTEQGISLTGSYSYTSPEGQFIEVKYVADENGFQPIGDHIPKPEGGAALPVRSNAGGRGPARRF